MKSIQSVNLDFGFEDVPVNEDLNNEDLDNFEQPIEFTTDIDRSGSADSEIPFDYDFDAEVGFGIDIDVASLGDVSLDYPINSELILPENVETGSTFEIATGDDFSSSSPKITSSSLSLNNSLRLCSILGLESGRISNLDLPPDSDNLEDDFENLFAYDGFERNETTLLNYALPLGGSIQPSDVPFLSNVRGVSVSEFLNSISFNYNLPVTIRLMTLKITILLILASLKVISKKL